MPDRYQHIIPADGDHRCKPTDRSKVSHTKSVDALSPVHHAQLISYLKLREKPIGLLIKFNVVHLKDGIKRFVNGTNWK